MSTARPIGWPVRTRPCAVILAGGRSSRFGADKATATLGGRPMLGLLADALALAGFAVVISTTHQGHARFGFPMILDTEPQRGPLCALRDVLRVLRVPKLLLTACDMPLLRPPLAQWLWAVSGQRSVTLLSRGANGPSPVPGVYAHEVLPVVEAQLRAGRQGLHSVWEAACDAQIVPPARWQQHDPSGMGLVNINTRADAVRAGFGVPCQS